MPDVATNPDELDPDTEVWVGSNLHERYHLEQDCYQLDTSNGPPEPRTKAEAEQWGYECCADCAREVDKSGEYGRQAASILKNADTLADAREQAQAQGD